MRPWLLLLISLCLAAPAFAASSTTAGITAPGTTNYPSLGMRLRGIFTVEDQIRCGVIDTLHGYAYFGTNTTPGVVIKVALGAGNAPAHRVAALSLQNTEGALSCAVIDPANGYAYFGTGIQGTLGYVVKVAL